MRTITAQRGRDWTNVGAWSVIAALALILVAPALTPVHVEGFSASIESIGMHLARGDLRHYDLQFPFNLEFFTISRFGMNVAVATVYAIFPSAGEWAMRGVMWVGLAALAWAAVVLVRRWTGCCLLNAVAGLLVIPGVLESSYFYNDNVPSAGAAAAALALLGKRHRCWSVAVAGALFGVAVLVRADAILLAPAAVLVVLEDEGWTRRLVVRCGTFAAASLVVIVAAPAALGFTFIDTMCAAQTSVTLWNRVPSIAHHRDVVLYFLGIPAALLAGMGAALVLRSREWLRATTLLVVPIFYNVVYAGKMWEARQLLPLTPFACALAVLGWARIAAAPRRLRTAAVCALLFLVGAPPDAVAIQDGPRTVLGRLWTPLLWSRWQGDVRRQFDDIRRSIEGARGEFVIVTDYWDADRYLHVTLQEAGFASVDPAPTAGACGTSAEWFRRGDTTIRHVRLHTPMVWYSNTLLPLRFDAFLAPCLPRDGPVIYVATADRVASWAGVRIPPQDQETTPLLPWLRRLPPRIIAAPLSGPELRRLRVSYQRFAAGVPLAAADRDLAPRVFTR